ncbi:unnamed protein product [Acanthoscelides obtectus]|uniref:Uncharacterized protein n=1 Tax=Acanthoscelides obtectus TaxID=200917 RepID=A0A9P0PZX9_ACAOB|nr:unnamed protein product [Acanthoscelides obtectus]CAK1682806.1 hypothetical protein AOBTE_LOCUS33899 [Acanthoscelides obtectus]
MGTTQIKTTPTHKIESDSTGEPNSNSEKELSPLQQNVLDESIPTPFKQTLFWPTPKENIAKHKLMNKVPAVATSSQWQQYYQKKKKKRKNKKNN